MVATMNWLLVLASESHGIPGSDWRAKIAVPLGAVLFLGSIYMLVRANLGTRRGYLVTATSLFGFMIIYSLFWAFGAPGTPPATGPQNLPGQELDAYEDTWRAFAGDSTIANDPNYAVAKTFPEGFAPTPEEAGLPENVEAQAETGSDDIKTFFSTAEADGGAFASPPMGGSWEPVSPPGFEDDPKVTRLYAKAENGRAIIGVVYQQTWQIAQLPPGEELPEGAPPPLTPDGVALKEDDPKTPENEANAAPEGVEMGDVVEGGETYQAFAFFDPGSQKFPSLITLGLMLLLFIIHALLLAMDERKERREREAAATRPVAEERVPAEAGRP
jgi:hypothetical protein